MRIGLAANRHAKRIGLQRAHIRGEEPSRCRARGPLFLSVVRRARKPPVVVWPGRGGAGQGNLTKAGGPEQAEEELVRILTEPENGICYFLSVDADRGLLRPGRNP
jgi:hypothetical protein